MEGVLNIIYRRVTLLGIEEPIIRRSRDNRVSVHLPRAQFTGNIEEVKTLIERTAILEFRERTCTDATCTAFTDANLGLTGDDLADVFASTSTQTGEWMVNIQFNSRGSEIFSDLTQRTVGQQTKRIAVFLDDEQLIASIGRAWIRNGKAVITGNFTREEARTLAIQLESGHLPVPLKLVEEIIPE